MNILNIGKNKIKCQHFTPTDMVESMLDLAGYKDNLIGISVLENSFGSGNILKAIVKRYINFCVFQNISPAEISKLLERDIYGIELDEQLYNGCIDDLNIIINSYNLPAVNWQLFNENALTHKYNKKFDLIIGNPPYISYKEIDEQNRQFLKENFKVCKLGKPDYCYAFIELGINLLSAQGKLVQLIPNNIYKNVFARELRNLLKPNIAVIRDYPNQKLFGKALTSISVFLYDKNYTQAKFIYENKTEDTQLRIHRDQLSDKWSFSECLNDSIEYVRFGDVFNASVSIATLCNKAFILYPNEARQKHIEEEVLRNTVSPKTLHYEKEKKIIFPYYYENGVLKKYEDFETRFPFATRHLREFYDNLMARDSDINARWYEYGRSQALAHLNVPKLLVSTIITNRVEIYQLNDTTIPYSGIYITVIDEKYNLQTAFEILSSAEFMQYVKNIGIRVNGQSLRISCKDINNYRFAKEK